MKLEAGKFYRNGHGDRLGPMEERLPDLWIDQHGGLYGPTGIQWNHVPESAGNIVSKEYDGDPLNDWDGEPLPR